MTASGRDDAPPRRPAHPRPHAARRRAVRMKVLGDLGAEIIKIEDPTTGGDEARNVPPDADRRRQPLLPVVQPQHALADAQPARRRPAATLLHRLAARCRRRLRQPARRPAGQARPRLRQPEGRQPAHRLLHAHRLRPQRSARRRSRLRLPAAGAGRLHERHRRARRAADEVRRLDRRLLRRLMSALGLHGRAAARAQQPASAATSTSACSTPPSRCSTTSPSGTCTAASSRSASGRLAHPTLVPSQSFPTRDG